MAIEPGATAAGPDSASGAQHAPCTAVSETGESGSRQDFFEPKRAGVANT